MSAQTSREKCPLCLEEMDLTDKELKPCKCGYEICLWCWHHIMEMDHKDESGGKCPGCRSVYNKDRIMGTSVGNKILTGLCVNKLNLQKEQNKSQKPKSSNVQSTLAEEPKDPENVRVIQRKLVYIVGMPSEFANPKVLKQKNFLGQYGKIENIVIDNVGANQQIPDSGRVYVTFSMEQEAARCIQAVNGYILDGRPLKATFGVTRYCHVWLSNRTCWKQNCSYVHYKAAPEDICSRGDVSVFCSRIQQLMGMDTKGFQHRSGSTLPPPANCNSRPSVCSGLSKDICSDDDRLLHIAAAKNPDLLPATSRDLNVTSGSQNEHTNEQLASNNDKSQASAQLGNDSSNSKQMISAENGTSAISLQKPQYVSVVSQGQGGSGRRFTVLSRQGASTDTGPKATGQVVNGTSNSTKLTLTKNERSDSISIPRSQNVNLVSQNPEHPLQLWASKSVKSHAQAEKNNESSDISSKLVPGNQKSLSENTVPNSSTAVHTTSCRPMVHNPSTSDVKSQASARLHNLSGSNVKLASQNPSQLVNQQSASVSNTGIARASLGRNILNNQVPSADIKSQNSAQGGSHCLCNREITRSGHCSDSIWLSKPPSVVSSKDMAAPDGKGLKKLVRCPPGFEKLQPSRNSGKIGSWSPSTSYGPCSTTDALVQDSCGITDQPHIITMVSHCLDDGDVTQNKNASISPLTSADTIWRRAQFPGNYSNHLQVSPYPNGFLECVGPVSRPSYQQSNLDGTTVNYMSTGGYDSFYHGTTSGVTPAMVGTLIQQPPPDSMTPRNADPGMNCPQVNISYPSGYTLF